MKTIRFIAAWVFLALCFILAPVRLPGQGLATPSSSKPISEQFRLMPAPATLTSAGKPGDFAKDATYLYVYTGTGNSPHTWSKIPLGLTTASLDLIGSTRGSVLYRGASAWSILAPGTAGYSLVSGGAGADPSYVQQLKASNNLSDLSNAGTARTNLGLGSLATQSGLPTGTTMAGSILATPIAAPSTPASGKGSIYVDSTSKNIAVKDDAGVVKHGVQTVAAAANTFVSAISDAGAVTTANSGSLVLEFSYSTAPSGATGGSGSWSYVLPTGAKFIRTDLAISSGGGGGAGGRFASGTNGRGGGGGGPGNRISSSSFLLVSGLPSSTLTVVIGQGGAGASGQTTNDTAGGNGSNGSGSYAADSNGVKLISSGTNTPTGGLGGGNASGGTAGANTTTSGYAFGASPSPSGTTSGAGGTTGAGSSGGDGLVTSPAGNNVGSGGGGAIPTVPSNQNGGAGGSLTAQTSVITLLAGPAGGVGANGADSTTLYPGIATGASGGSSNASGAGFRGGNGAYGNGGGGGGASLNGSTSGAGGNGGDGYIRITVFF